MDDEIIYSWCFNSIKYFDLTSSVAIVILIKKLESLSSLRSQHEVLLINDFPEFSGHLNIQEFFH